MKPNTTLPARVDSAMLAKYRQDGEPVIILKLIGVGNTALFDFRDKGTRSYVFRFDSTFGGHIIRIPLSLWQANKGQMAHDIMDQRRTTQTMIVLVEMPTPAPIEQPSLTEPLTATNAGDAQFTIDCIKATIASYKDSDNSNAEESLRECLDRISNAVSGTITAPASTPESPQMGATDTSAEVRNVVGPDDVPTVAPASSPSNETTADDGSQHMVGDVHLFQAAYDLVESPKRLKALAALLGVEETPLREAIGCPMSKVELVTAGWVRRKESTSTPTAP